MIIDIQVCVDFIIGLLRSLMPIAFIWAFVRLGVSAVIKAATGRFKGDIL